MSNFRDPQRRTDDRYMHMRNSDDVPSRPTSRRLAWRVTSGLSVLVFACSIVLSAIMHILSRWDRSLF